MHGILPMFTAVTKSVTMLLVDHSRPFISYWTRGAPSDLSVACEVIGSDPKYAFQRTCDYTPAVGIFRDALLQNTSYVAGKTQISSRLRDLNKGKMVVELRGKCFNATVTVQKHIDRCPWCAETTTAPQVISSRLRDLNKGKMVVELRGKCFNATVTVQKHIDRCPWCAETTTAPYVVVIPKTEVPRKMTGESMLEERLELVGVSILATICVLSATAFACLLVAYLKQRSNVESRENEKTYVANLMKISSRLRDLNKGKMVVELRGKCFNATVTVQKHIDRCPWCAETTTAPQVVVITKTEVPRKMTGESMLEERLELVGVSILATICVLSATAFACLLVAYLKQRSNVESRENEKTYVANLMKVDSPFRNSNQIE
uniref:Ephrin_rec_like domain-containing protein n=2 Tax=Ascaris lumbricoides TaxID=6252 RepID=A0A0M3IUQ3_ASCLU